MLFCGGLGLISLYFIQDGVSPVLIGNVACEGVQIFEHLAHPYVPPWISVLHGSRREVSLLFNWLNEQGH